MEWIGQNKQKLLWASFLLVVVAFPVLTIGVNDGETLTWAGMAMVAAGFAIPPLIRLLGPKGDEDEKKPKDDGSSDKGDDEAWRERHENRGQDRPEGGG